MNDNTNPNPLMGTNELGKQTVTPYPALDVDRMSDEDIKQLIARAYRLLDKRKREREKAIKEQIRQMANQAGIKVSFTGNKAHKSK